MTYWKLLAGGVATAALASAIVQPAMAQVTTASMRGDVVGEAGTPVSNAAITIIHTPSGTTENVTTNETGSFAARNLRVGGPYTVVVNAPGEPATRVEGIFLSIGQTASVPITLESARTMDAVVVVGSAGSSQVQTGPRSTFGLDVIESLPSISRDIRDIARLDPRVSVDPTNDGAITIAGTNNRFNSLTIDGIRFNDLFGLNANGFPSQRSPISIDALESLSVEVSPTDVEYSAFTGGQINVLTKSGTNDFSGSAYYFYTDDSMAGDDLGDRRIDRTFEEKTFGFTLGGPIIQDKLFFFAAYEELEEAASLQNGPVGSGAVNIRSGVSQAQVDQVQQILSNVYGVDAGGFAGGQPVQDKKLLATLDWNITDNQRLKFTYIDNEGNEIQEQNDGDTLGLSSTWYDRSEETTAYAGQLFSSWTENFTTEVKVAYTEQKTGQDSLNGSDFANFSINLGNGSSLSVGPDFFRHANALENELLQIKVKGEYLFGDHLFKAGFERDDQTTFNLFVPGSEGSYVFSSIADLQNRQAASLFYQNAISNEENDGAADWGYAVTSFYLQDEWAIRPDLTIIGGLRYEYYESDGTITENQNFINRYGFSNTGDLDGLDILLPRLGFNWDVRDNLTLRGGVGRFSGGAGANVWISNNYSNDGVTIDSTFTSNPAELSNVDAFNIPSVVQARLSAGDGDVNVLDPNFEIPSIYRANLGLDYTFDLGFSEGWEVSFDYIYSDQQDSTFWRDISCQEVLFNAIDGRPVYNCGLNSAFMQTLTGAGQQNVYDFYDDNGIAVARVAGIGAFDTNGNGTVSLSEVEVAPQALLLTNIDEGEQQIFSTSIRKDFDNGVGLFFAYTYTDAEDGHSGTSSTASSNYSDIATLDYNNPSVGTSNYEREHEFTLRLDWEKEFVEDFPTRFTLFGSRRSGQPFSYTYDYSGGDERSFYGIREGSADDEGELFYVPTGFNDPLFSAASFGGNAVTQAAFFDFLATSGLNEYAGGIAERNAFNSRWYTNFDFRFQQEFPGFFPKRARSIFFLDIENIGNLINDDWGRLEQVGFEYFQPVANQDIVNGQYVYSGFPERSEKRITEGASLWQVQLGFKYQF